MKPTEGRTPRSGDTPLKVLFRNGRVGGPYTAKQLNWRDRSYEWDVVAVERFKDGRIG